MISRNIRPGSRKFNFRRNLMHHHYIQFMPVIKTSRITCSLIQFIKLTVGPGQAITHPTRRTTGFLTYHKFCSIRTSLTSSQFVFPIDKGRCKGMSVTIFQQIIQCFIISFNREIIFFIKIVVETGRDLVTYQWFQSSCNRHPGIGR